MWQISRVCTHTYIFILTYVLHTYTQTYTRTHRYTYTCTNTYKHTHMCIHTHVHICTHIHVHTYRTRENYGRGIVSYLPKFSPANIHRYTENVYGICTLFSSPIAFTCMACQNFPLPNISHVQYIRMHTYTHTCTHINKQHLPPVADNTSTHVVQASTGRQPGATYDPASVDISIAIVTGI